MSKTETTKMNTTEIQAQIAAKQTELATLRRNVALQRDPKNHQIKVLRRDIARLLTTANQSTEETK